MDIEGRGTHKLSSADLPPGLMAEEMVVEGWEVTPEDTAAQGGHGALGGHSP